MAAAAVRAEECERRLAACWESNRHAAVSQSVAHSLTHCMRVQVRDTQPSSCECECRAVRCIGVRIDGRTKRREENRKVTVGNEIANSNCCGLAASLLASVALDPLAEQSKKKVLKW